MKLIEQIKDLKDVPLCTEEIDILNRMHQISTVYFITNYPHSLGGPKNLQINGEGGVDILYVESLCRRGLIEQFNLENDNKFWTTNAEEFENYDQLTELRLQIAVGTKHLDINELPLIQRRRNEKKQLY